MRGSLISRRWSRAAAVALAAVVLALPACGKDSTAPVNTSLMLVGTVNGDDGSFSASISLSINGAAVTGQLKIVSPSASTVALSGTYNSGSKALAASGGGYSFAGGFNGVDRMDGTMSGSASGTFVAKKDDSSAALAFCGTFSGSDDGVFNFTLTGSSIAGSATTTSGTVIPLDGSVSGSSISIANPGGGSALATGTRSGDNVSGTWDNSLGSSGDWTGARCN